MASGATDRPCKDQGAVSCATIVLVEDNDDVGKVTAMLLSRLGYTVLEAESGVAALTLLEQGIEATLLMADFGLPDMTGRQLAVEAQGRWPALKILLMTGYPLRSLALKFYNEIVLEKPYTLQDLRSAIDRALHPSAAIDATKRG